MSYENNDYVKCTSNYSKVSLSSSNYILQVVLCYMVLAEKDDPWPDQSMKHWRWAEILKAYWVLYPDINPFRKKLTLAFPVAVRTRWKHSIHQDLNSACGHHFPCSFIRSFVISYLFCGHYQLLWAHYYCALFYYSLRFNTIFSVVKTVWCWELFRRQRYKMCIYYSSNKFFSIFFLSQNIFSPNLRAHNSQSYSIFTTSFIYIFSSFYAREGF